MLVQLKVAAEHLASTITLYYQDLINVISWPWKFQAAAWKGTLFI